jgi:hypothetical protein
MREKVIADQFWERFSTSLHKHLRNNSNWEQLYSNSKTWTVFMFDFLYKFSDEKYNYSTRGECSTEYLRVDMGCFDKSNVIDTNNKKYNGYEWDFDIAIEHENDETRWFEEFVKLIHVNCGLKVLIAYHSYDRDLSERIEALESIFNNRKYKNLNDQWLIILGPTLKDKANRKDFIAFKSIIDIDSETIKFVELSDRRIIF